MCIGIKPVFMPMAVAKGEVGLRVGSISATSCSTASVASFSGVSRKRPLDEDSSPNSLPSSSPSVCNRKMMRYSTCTCSFRNGCSATIDSSMDVTSKCSKSNRRSNRVRFGSFKTFVAASHSLSDEDRKVLWYGLDECAEMNEASKAHVNDVRHSEHKDTMRHVLCVASQCSYSPPPLAYLQMVRLNLPDETRGLELGLLPLRIRQRRHEHVNRVVEVQKQIAANKARLNIDEQVKAKALAIQCMRSSQPSRLFAELLARNVAADEHAGATADGQS